jgi:hypothetical protein
MRPHSALLLPRTIGLAACTAVLAIGPVRATAARGIPIDRSRSGVRVDSARHTVVVSVGPFHLEPAMPMMEHMTMEHMEGGDSLVKLFDWPMTTLLQGLRLEITDSSGQPLPRRLLHHLNLVNFDRRALVYPLVERMMGFGQETEDVSVPRSIGLPMTAGQHVGLYVMWDNQTGHALDDVYVHLTFRWAPGNLVPRPISVMPFTIDAHLVPGGHNTFAIPPGGFTQRFDFTFPLNGHLVAAGGHLHDHGLRVSLLDRTSGQTVVTVVPKRDSMGHVTGMSRALLALRGEGPYLRADHQYRLEVEYENPTADTLTGMMGLLVGLFAPDDPSAWPAIDPRDADYQKDIADILGPAAGGPGEMSHDHP